MSAIGDPPPEPRSRGPAPSGKPAAPTDAPIAEGPVELAIVRRSLREAFRTLRNILVCLCAVVVLFVVFQHICLAAMGRTAAASSPTTRQTGAKPLVKAPAKSVTGEESTAGLLAEAREAFEGGELGRAARMCRKWLQRNPNDANAHFLFGLIAQKIGDVEAARRSYAQARQAGLKSPSLLNNLGVLELHARNFEAAAGDFDAARALAPESATIRNNSGTLALLQGRLKEARQSYEEALALDENLAEASFNLSVLFFRRGHLDEAGQRLEALITSSPPSVRADTHRLLGQLYESIDLPETALDQYKKALEIRANSYRTINDFAVALLNAGKTQQALVKLNEAIALKGDYAPSYNNRGVAFARLGRLEEAAADFARAATLDASFSEAHFNYAFVAERLGNYLTAIHQYEKAVTANPRCWQALNNLALIYSRGDAFSRAIELATKATKMNSPEAYRTLALLLLQANRRKDALAAMKKHLALHPNPQESDLAPLAKRLESELDAEAGG